MMVPLYVYVAQPLDYRTPDARERHLLTLHNANRADFHPDLIDISVYCPACERIPGEPVTATMERNMKALRQADAVVAVFDGTPSFGTPVEVWLKSREAPMRVCVIHPGRQGLFLQYIAREGVEVVEGWDEAVNWLRIKMRHV